MVRAGQAQIAEAGGLDEVALRLPGFHRHLNRDFRAVADCGPDRHLGTDECGQRRLIRFYLRHRLASVSGVFVVAPRDGDAVDQAVALQAAVDDPHLPAVRVRAELLRQRLELCRGELRRAGHVLLVEEAHIVQRPLPGFGIIPVDADENIPLRECGRTGGDDYKG